MNNLLITKENKKTKRFILVFLLFTIYFFSGYLIFDQNERSSLIVKNESVTVSYTHLLDLENVLDLVFRYLREKTNDSTIS